MYKYSRDSRDLPIKRKTSRIIGITSRGEELEINADSVGLIMGGFSRIYVKKMWRGDSATAQRLGDRLNRDREDPIVEFHLEIQTYTITDTGIVTENNPVVIYRVE